MTRLSSPSLTFSIGLSGDKKKPYRPCLYCGEQKASISSHLLSVHKNEDKIKDILLMDRNHRLLALARLRKEGIMEHNKTLVSEGKQSDELVGERASGGEKVMCGQCHGMFKKTCFFRHINNCLATEGHVSRPVSVDPCATGLSTDADWDNVWRRMDHDEMYATIISDKTILCVGKHIYDGRKPAKQKDAKIKSRSAMRRLARLVAATDTVTEAGQLFSVSNFYNLEDGIASVCQTEAGPNGRVKAGLQVAIGSLIRLAAKVLQADFIINQKPEEAQAIELFVKVFNLNYCKIFSRAEYQLKETRQRQNRKPTSLPIEEHLEKLRSYLRKEIKAAINRKSTITKRRYVHLRKVIITRLTLLNGRRGSEASRILLKDFEERHDWIVKGPQSNRYALAFIMGKGNGLVPVLIPKDCERGMDILTDPAARLAAGINIDNEFVFAYTQNSADNTTGYNEIRDICQLIHIPTITATAVRHRSSTLFWRMEGIDDATIRQFMDHLGHSTEVDKNIYAVPPAQQILETVGRVIHALDQVCWSASR